MKVMIGLSLIGTMLCVGMAFRAKIPFLREMLVPSSVIAGVFGLILMNTGVVKEVNSNLYTEIVNEIFTISFISIGLTNNAVQDDSKGKNHNTAKGAWGLGMIWNLIYGLTPIIGVIIILFMGRSTHMNPIYGMLVPFGFAQGPGQAAAFGKIFENYGYANAATVGVTFAAFGFLSAFLIGVPLAKWGIKRKYVKNGEKINESVKRGYYAKEEQSDLLGHETTHSGNIDTLGFHFALIGISYILAIFIAKLFTLLPGFLGSSMSGMMFFNGMLAAYIVRFFLNKLHLDYLQDNHLQNKITGWMGDFLVVGAFMAIKLSVIGNWILPIAIECVVVTILTILIIYALVPRLGGDNAFERVLGLYGTSTGTIPSGIALVRIVDPALKTSTTVELGLMNLPMMFSAPVYMIILAAASGTISKILSVELLAIAVVVYFLILLATRCVGKSVLVGENK